MDGALENIGQHVGRRGGQHALAGVGLRRVGLEQGAGRVTDLEDVERPNAMAAVRKGAIRRKMVDHAQLAGAERRRQARIERGVDAEAARGRKDFLDADVLEEMHRRDVARLLQRVPQRDGTELAAVPVVHRIPGEGLGAVAVVKR